MKLKPQICLALLAIFSCPRGARAQDRVLANDLTDIAAAANGGRIINETSTLDNDKAYDASNLISGKVFDPATNTGVKGWVSNKFDPINMESVTLGFRDNAEHKIGKIVIDPVAAVTPERWAKDIEVQVSTDTAEGPYQAVSQITLQRKAQPQEFLILPVDARFVRLIFRSNWGSDRAVALGSVQMYESIDTTDPLGQLIVRLEGAVRELSSYRKTQIDASNGGGQMVGPAALHNRPLSHATLQMVQLMTDGDGNGGASFPVSSVDIAAAKNGGHVLAWSSIFDKDPTYGPNNLIDGQVFDMATGKGSNGWSSQGFVPGKEFVTLGFKDDRTRLIGKIVVNPASNQSDLRWARRIDVQVTSGSFDTGPWRTVATINVADKPINQEFLIRPAEAKYVRFVFMANGPGDIPIRDGDPNIDSDRSVSLGEIEMYEAVSTGDQLTAIIGRLSQILADMKTLHGQEKAAGTLAPAALTAQPPARHLLQTVHGHHTAAAHTHLAANFAPVP